VELEGLEVKVSPPIETVPMGAPIRIDFCLANNGSQKMPVPGSLNMKTGHVSGEVIDPFWTKRTFSTPETLGYTGSRWGPPDRG
jgi:hypothetical protein